MEYLNETERQINVIKVTESKLREAGLFEVIVDDLEQELESKGSLLGKRLRNEWSDN